MSKICIVKLHKSSLAMWSANAFASSGGTALPICLHTCVFLPKNIKLSLKLWILAASRGVIERCKNGWEFVPLLGVSNLVSIVGLTSFHFSLPQVVLNCCLPCKFLGKHSLPFSLGIISSFFMAI